MKFDGNKYKVSTWTNAMKLHWILNPGFVFDELIFGQRVPKVMLEEKTFDESRLDRSFVPCPHCDKIHNVRTWSIQNQTVYRNWFGLYCPDCGEVIPCLTNVFSFVILAITFPIWGWFRKSLKENWLKQQPARFENLDLEYVPKLQDKEWIKMGLKWGAFMFLFMTLVVPYFQGMAINRRMLLAGLAVWPIAGLLFG